MQPEEVLKMMLETWKVAGLVKTEEEEAAFEEKFWSLVFPSTEHSGESLKK